MLSLKQVQVQMESMVRALRVCVYSAVDITHLHLVLALSLSEIPPIVVSLAVYAHGTSLALYVNGLAGSSTQTVCISSLHVYPPLFHQISLTKQCLFF